MKKTLKVLAIAAAVAVPAAAFAQTPMYSESVTIYDSARYESFVDREGGALQSGGATLPDILLADNVAMALADDPRLDGATVTVVANDGRVSINGSANYLQSEQARQVARRVAGVYSVSGELSNTGG